MHQTHSNKVAVIESKNNLKRLDCDAMLTKNKGYIIYSPRIRMLNSNINKINHTKSLNKFRIR